MREPNWKELPIANAVKKYAALRAAQVSPSTLKTWKWNIKSFEAHFRKKPLGRWTPADIDSYQLTRQATGKAPGTINLELSFLRQILKRARLWAKFSESYHPIPNTKTPPGRAIAQEEIAQLFSVAASKKKWADICDALKLAFFAGMRMVEIRNLRWKDINLADRSLYVHRSKTKAGQRSMILNDTVFEALAHRFTQAVRDQRNLPEHFVFYWQGRGGADPDPSRPRVSFRSAWRQITKAAGLAGLRMHDGRHTAVTTLLEAGVPEWVVLAHAGHIDPRMIATYSHIRRQALTEAAQALDRKPPAQESRPPESSAQEQRKAPSKVHL